MKRVQLIISLMLFAGVIGAAVWLYFDARGAGNKASITDMLADDVAMLMEGEVVIRESSGGRMGMEITGKDLAYMEESREVRLDRPLIRVWPEDGGIFSIRGDKVIYFLDAPVLDIRGEIKGISDDGYHLQTEWLRYFPSEARVETEAPIKISRADFVLTGKGMTFNMEQKILEVASEAKVIIRKLNPEKQ